MGVIIIIIIIIIIITIPGFLDPIPCPNSKGSSLFPLLFEPACVTPMFIIY